MKEQVKPSFERGRKVVALGSIGIGSYADQDQVSWSLAVTCEEGSNPHITYIQSSPSSRGSFRHYHRDIQPISLNYLVDRLG